MKQDKEMFVVPRRVQDLIPVQRIWPDGIFQVGTNKYSKTWKFSDINYQVASEEDKDNMFLLYSDVLNSFDSAATTKITVNNHRLNKKDFENSILMPMKHDGLDDYRQEYNDMLLEKATGANGLNEVLGNLHLAQGLYAQAEEDFAEVYSNSAVLAQILNHDYVSAAVTLKYIQNLDATSEYLRALMSALMNNNDDAAEALREAIKKDASLAKYAANDIELQKIEK